MSTTGSIARFSITWVNAREFADLPLGDFRMSNEGNIYVLFVNAVAIRFGDSDIYFQY